MRVRMKASISGTVDGFVLPPKGNEVDLPEHVAADLCASGHADPVATEPAVETATLPDEDVEDRADPDDVDALRERAQSLGVKVDKRWGADRLREEIDKNEEK